MRKATKEEIELLYQWVKGFEVAAWLGKIAGYKVNSFRIEGGSQYNDEGYYFWPDVLVLNGTAIFERIDEDDENYDELVDVQYDQKRDYEYSYDSYYNDSPDDLYNALIKYTEEAWEWDGTKPPFNIWVKEND